VEGATQEREREREFKWIRVAIDILTERRRKHIICIIITEIIKRNWKNGRDERTHQPLSIFIRFPRNSRN
jgi:hypothetical protein